jgi:hypothetical protein
MATSEAFTAGLIIVIPLFVVLGILGACWRRQLRQEALRKALAAEAGANQGRGTAEDTNAPGRGSPA